MEDERRRILELVEQGRISAQEANELLATLEEPPVRRGGHHREPRCGRGDWGRVGGSVGGIMDTVMRALFRRLEGRGQRRER